MVDQAWMTMPLSSQYSKMPPSRMMAASFSMFTLKAPLKAGVKAQLSCTWLVANFTGTRRSRRPSMAGLRFETPQSSTLPWALRVSSASPTSSGSMRTSGRCSSMESTWSTPMRARPASTASMMCSLEKSYQVKPSGSLRMPTLDCRKTRSRRPGLAAKTSPSRLSQAPRP